MLQTILLILSIAGALPEAIDGFKSLWAWIDQIRDSKTRRQFKVETAMLAVSHACKRLDHGQCKEVLDGATEEIKGMVEKEKDPWSTPPSGS